MNVRLSTSVTRLSGRGVTRTAKWGSQAHDRGITTHQDSNSDVTRHSARGVTRTKTLAWKQKCTRTRPKSSDLGQIWQVDTDLGLSCTFNKKVQKVINHDGGRPPSWTSKICNNPVVSHPIFPKFCVSMHNSKVKNDRKANSAYSTSHATHLPCDNELTR